MVPKFDSWGCHPSIQWSKKSTMTAVAVRMEGWGEKWKEMDVWKLLSPYPKFMIIEVSLSIEIPSMSTGFSHRMSTSRGPVPRTVVEDDPGSIFHRPSFLHMVARNW